MAQMAPALTEANASPGSSRKNSVDRYCSSSSPDELRENSPSFGVDLKLLSQNGFVRFLGDSINTNNITNTTQSVEKNTPKGLRRNEEICTKTDMPNGDHNEKPDDLVVETKISVTTAGETRNTAVDLHLARTCASTTTETTPAGTCDTEHGESNRRLTQHPVAVFESTQALFAIRSTKVIHQQPRLETRAKTLEKRLRRLQARQIDSHVRQQLGGFVDQQRANFNFSSDLLKSGMNSAKISLSDIKEGQLHDLKDKRKLSASKLHAGEYDNGSNNGMKETSSSLSRSFEKTVEELESKSKQENEKHMDSWKGRVFTDEERKLEAETTIGSLKGQLEHLENVGDSDATDESSGDESDEEEKGSKHRNKSSKTLQKRFWLEEGQISSRWSWLQSQVINLERQIRRYDEIYKTLRVGKKPVQLQDVASKRLEGNVKNSNLPKVSNRPASVAEPMQTGTPSEKKLNAVLKDPENHLRNGVRKHLLEDSPIIDEDEIPLKRLRTALMKNDVDSSSSNSYSLSSTTDSFVQSARTRGVHPVRKRRLLHLSTLERKIKKTGSSTCGCMTPLTPCISCPKVARSSVVVDASMTRAARVALLDHSYHRIMSFSNDAPLHLHFGSLLKKGGFEARTKPPPVKTCITPERSSKKPPAPRANSRKSNIAKLKGAAASLLTSAKLRNQKYDKKKGHSSLPSTPKNNSKVPARVCQTEVREPRKKRAAAISAAAQLQRRARSLSLPMFTSSSPSTPSSSPSPTPSMSSSMPTSGLGSLLRRKRSSNAFDINNIVIPYSMASTTRVEKLQYKEIPTPSWRVNEVQPMTKDKREVSVKKIDPVKVEENKESLVEEKQLSVAGKESLVAGKELSVEEEKEKEKKELPQSEVEKENTAKPEEKIAVVTKEEASESTGNPDGAPEVTQADQLVDELSEEEDLSDDVIVVRHLKCEEQERKRFLGLIKKKRKRATRASSETSVFEPASPTVPETPPSRSGSPPTMPPPGLGADSAPVTPGGNPSPTTRLSRSESKLGHRRSSSSERVERKEEFESIWPVVPPWSLRTFPLSETEVDSLKLPTPLPTPVQSTPPSPSPTSGSSSPMCSPLASPASDAGSEGTGNEWTVKLVTTDQGNGSGNGSGQPRKGIVLKLAKR